MAGQRIKHWTPRLSKRRKAPFWEIRNTRGVVFICYGTRADAELAAAAPRLCAELKNLISIARLHEGALRSIDKAEVAKAQALINELNGGN